ncbi:TPA: restriction endonuclease subunit S [Vibrio parahaemolyticus]|uniref:restriction endonuclease subunit S n=2 Tax=Vibrio parahaemolyticus TaxID=670 RepID=UPI0005B74ED5|nr:restriction endonuclease subunit S [Vibrio parahaemolyticus]EGQ7778929.1 restriction endonuclease subunit S [Vibrio parahaemolyticus]EGQ8396234.1 restriction endonuclease subunit S [Vibrio parahaemolyticus]EGQ9049777.1 restriction endonuclease subunit S [Vibrio parahaemolyticus]EGQ9588918.1 restriction endonuclease subunit S [Vibrio parahaemolyticus]EGR1000847.1 restriction endonuclease subunit S [Vibrio parahaemolyticus]
MSFDWTDETLGDLISRDEAHLQTGPFGTALKASEYSEDGVPLISVREIREGFLQIVKDTPRVCEATTQRLPKFLLQQGDIVFGRKGAVDRNAVISFEQEGWFLGSDGIRLRLSNKYDSLFFSYLMRSSATRAWLLQNSEGTTMLSLNQKTLARVPVRYPTVEIQKRISTQLRTLDDKITLNIKINQTLEQMAQAIFKSWFVDFDPVKAKMNGEQPEGMDEATASFFPEKLVESELGLIPEGWEVGDLSDLMDFNPKRTLKKGTVAPYLDMKNMPTSGHLALDIYDREMGSGTKFMNGDSLLARITPCLENGKTAYVDFLEDEQVGWGSTEYIVMRSKSDSYKYFSYFMARFEPFRKFAIQSMTGTSGRQRAQAKTVQTMPFVIPPLSILEKFDELITANMTLIKRHGDENKTLAELRDTLLPKLLSGEITLD